MTLFIGSFVAFLLTALALGVGIIVRGQPMHAGCSGLPGESVCDSQAVCGGVCRRRS